ncbi:MAG: bifunctional diaminohydroxyphosphoribosylaminopyrimidine deaminase/5-amino-6-(5-phosphoribosylamino)uracil reductase RibD [Firmicutes bacterium]|nr:bifunctional diaminohydroxyphosphoribosylaminopyrimidine deaminase/5-amino-6-(5-phosphoribosylamino)uracil reductase RibD [Bacillota bacterium]
MEDSNSKELYLEDRRWMQRCLDLASRARGQTSPNPLVGAVIVKEGKLVGEGYHKKAGDAHAEVVALNQAGSNARGGTLYVNLEPCCHYGKTPPCTKQIIAAGIKRVVVAIEDQNDLVCGKGITELKAAGIDVEVGILSEEATKLNEVFFKHMRTKKPFVLWKVASTLDGKVALQNGQSRWITSQEARKEVHQLRAEYDAILVGSGTILADDPMLNVRPLPEGFSHPVRVILDTSARVSPEAKVFSEPGGVVLWVVGKDAQIPKIPNVPEICEVVRSPEEEIQIEWLLTELGRRKITSLLLEGGPTVVASFVEAKAIDKVQWYLAPKLIGSEGRSALGKLSIEEMARVPELVHTTIRQIGVDFCIEGYPVWETKGG